MPPSCIVLIASADLLPVLKQRVQHGGELLAFTDRDSLAAVEAIVQRRPDVIAIDRAFAGTSRGNALITRITVDPSLMHSEIWVISDKTMSARVTPEPHRPAPAGVTLDDTGTRRVGRVAIREGVEIYIDGNPAELIDLSAGGAQVMSEVVLRPNQWVRVVLPDEALTVRANAVVAWANFEMRRPRLTPCYRAGLDFKDADGRAIEAFSVKYAAKPAHDSQVHT